MAQASNTTNFKDNAVDSAQGFKVNGVTVIDSSGNVNAPLVTTNITTTGNTILGDAVTDTTTVNGTLTVTTTSTSGMAVGANGATNPALKVDANTASSATGVKVTSAAAGAGVSVAAISSGTNEDLKVDGKGTGKVTIGGNSTGNVELGRATTVAGAVTVTSPSATAIAVGANGATNPVLSVDASAASVANGLKVTGTAANSGVYLSAQSSGSNEDLFLVGKGFGLARLSSLAGTATASGGAATSNSQVSVITTESLTTAADDTYTLTLTNNKITSSAALFISVGFGTCTAGRPVLEKWTAGAGSATIVVRNHAGATALNGTLLINVLVL